MRKKSFYKITKKEFMWIFVGIIFVFYLVIYFVNSFFENCIFEWPIRWDVGTCWDEQKEPAKQKAIEEAIKFAP